MRLNGNQSNESCFSRLFWALYFIMVALPLHASNHIQRYLSVTGMISVFHILFLIMALGMALGDFKRMKMKINWKTISVALFGGALILSVWIGIRNESHIFKNVIGDAGMYALAFFVLVLAKSDSVAAKTPDEFLRFTFHAVTVNLLMNLMMYLTRGFQFWGLEEYNGGRLGGGYYSLLIVTVTYGFYDYLYENKIKKKEFCAHVVMALFCSVLAQSRTHVILSAAGCLMVLYLGRKLLSMRYVWRAAGIMLAGTLIVTALLSIENPLTERLFHMDISSSTETTASRIVTWIYYWNRIKESFWGCGFGEKMYFISPHLLPILTTETYYVDNAVAVVLYKGGWSFGILYHILILYPGIKFIHLFHRCADKFFLIVAIIWIMLLFAVAIMTSQVIHTYAVLAFAWVFTGSCLKKEWGNTRIQR